MHVETNVAKQVMKHLYNSKPFYNRTAIIVNCEAANVHRSTWEPDENGEVTFPAWELDDDVLTKFNELLSKTRFPHGYGPAFKKCVNDGYKAPHGLKSHDYHKLMHDLLPCIIRAHGEGRGRGPVAKALYALCKLLR